LASGGARCAYRIGPADAAHGGVHLVQHVVEVGGDLVTAGLQVGGRADRVRGQLALAGRHSPRSRPEGGRPAEPERCCSKRELSQRAWAVLGEQASACQGGTAGGSSDDAGPSGGGGGGGGCRHCGR